MKEKEKWRGLTYAAVTLLVIVLPVVVVLGVGVGVAAADVVRMNKKKKQKKKRGGLTLPTSWSLWSWAGMWASPSASAW